MIITLSIEIKPNEFRELDKVLFTLTSEGWSVEKTEDFSITKPNKPKEIVEKRVYLMRVI